MNNLKCRPEFLRLARETGTHGSRAGRLLRKWPLRDWHIS
jgi:hypothetical protein